MTETSPARVVFDCMLVLQAAARPAGPAAACIALVEAGQVELCLSAEVLAEFHDVLLRPRLRRRFNAIGHSSIIVRFKNPGQSRGLLD